MLEKFFAVEPVMASRAPNIKDNSQSLRIKAAIKLMAELKIEEAQAHLKQIEKDLDINLNLRTTI